MQSIASFEAHLKNEGFQEATTVSRDAGYALGEHTHPFDACALITAGSITLQIGGIDTVYAAGDVFELARNTPHHEWAGAQGVAYFVGRRT